MAAAKQNEGKTAAESSREFGTGEGQLSPTAPDSELKNANVDTSEASELDGRDDVALYNLHAGLKPRVGGPYLDQVELEQAEIKRAVIEGREPDFKHNAGSAGVPLVTAAQLIDAHAPTLNTTIVLEELVTAHQDDDSFGPTPLTFAKATGDSTKVPVKEDGGNFFEDADKVTSHDGGLVFTDPSKSEK